MTEDTDNTEEYKPFTCGNCAACIGECEVTGVHLGVDAIDLEYHESIVVCVECAEQEWLVEWIQIIPDHSFIAVHDSVPACIPSEIDSVMETTKLDIPTYGEDIE